jgi:hypothetical protein
VHRFSVLAAVNDQECSQEHRNQSYTRGNREILLSFGKRNFSSGVRSHLLEVRILPIMTPILAKVTAIEKRGDQYQVIVQISPKYRGSFNTLAFGEIKPPSGSLKDGRLDLVYHQNLGFTIGDAFPLWTLH